MFSQISKNPPYKPGKKQYKEINQVVHFSFGRPEWQQKYSTTTGTFFDQKKLGGNREILDKDYLKNNFSGFDLIQFPQKQPFLSSNARDFKKIIMKDGDRIILSKEKISFIRDSKIVMGEHKPEKESIYGFMYRNPSMQKPRYNYSKINFKYDPYNLHPVLQTPIWKDPNNMNPFDYFNQNKDKHYIANPNKSYLNTDYRKVWDPITSRYFAGSLRALSENKKC